MVGEGLLLKCLQHTGIESVWVLGRRNCARTYPKLKEILHADGCNIAPIADQLAVFVIKIA